MVRLKATAWTVAAAAFTVGSSVAGNQVLDHGEFHLTWAYLAFLLAVLAACYAQLSSSGGPATAPATTALRGRRRVYLRQVRAHVRDMETTGIATQGEFVFRLRQVYVDVSLRSGTPQDATAAPYVGRSGTAEGRRKSLRSFLEDGGKGRVFAVLGGPGSGKTTLMRATAGDLCHWWRRRRLPVLLYLRDHATKIAADPEVGLADVAAGASWVTGRTPPSWIESHLKGADCLVMLDGLDEVADPAERTAVVTWVRRQIDRYPGNDYLLTSRPHGYQSNPLPRAEVLQVRRFTAEQISRFLHAWYYAIECRSTGTKGKQTRSDSDKKAGDLLSRLRSRPALYDLAANPLLLTMIANVHRYRAALPRSRAALYAEMCDVLVHRRQESKNLPDATELSGPQKEHIMGVLALTMMDARLRDISVDEACTAIRPALEGASPDLDPAVFLREVNKSGLLVEREHGRYAFAHLTLQEYLAAAQIGQDAGHLPEQVDDPWWRETILLWAAGSDVTPVIAACLDSGTVRALALAFDCADEARTVDRDVRRRLDALLDPPGTVRGDRRRLITAVRAARALREVIWLGENTLMCARPVDRSLYELFLRSEKSTRHWTPPPVVDGEGPVRGIWAGDVARFVAWLNGLFDDGTAYRLPTEEELADPAIGLVIDPRRHTVWRQGDGERPVLHRPDGAPWPYTVVPRIEVSGWPLTLALATVAGGPEYDKRIEAYGRIVAAAFEHVPGPVHDFNRDLLTRICGLVVARSFNALHEETRQRPGFQGTTPGVSVRATAVNHRLGRRTDLRDPKVVERYAVEALDAVFGKATEASAEPLDSALRTLLDEALGSFHIREIAGIDDEIYRALSAPEPVSGNPPRRSRLLGELRPDRAVLDLAVDLGIVHPGSAVVDDAESQTALDAFVVLLRRWETRGERIGRSSSTAFGDFQTFLSETYAAFSRAPRVSENPLDSLQSLRRRFLVRSHVGSPVPEEARSLVEGVSTFVEQALEQPSQWRRFDRVCSALLAAAVLLEEARESLAATMTINTLDSLAAIERLQATSSDANDVILLLRM